MTAIISYLEALFSSLPKTPEVLRMQAEMTENAEDRYRDLIAQGKSEAEAVGIVISGIGTLEELKAELGIRETAAPQSAQKEALTEEYYAFRKKFAVPRHLFVGAEITGPLFPLTNLLLLRKNEA